MSNPNTLFPSITCQSQYKQRQLLALWTAPPQRLNLNSPYINTYDFLGNGTLVYTKEQLDMRRKVEILRYANTDTKTNSLTKNQKWSQLNTTQNRFLSQYKIEQYASTPNLQPICNNLTQPTSTIACDVPGPPMILQYDPAVPLYNYATNVDSFSFLPPSPIFTFEFLTKNEIYFLTNYNRTILMDVSGDISTIITNTTMNDLGVILMGTGLQLNTYTFQLITPVGIWINGFISPTAKDYMQLTPPSSEYNIEIGITAYTINIFYSDTVIYTTTISISTPGDYLLSTMTFNLASLNTEPTLDFYAIQYIGNLAMDITLPVQPTYVYDVQIDYTYTYIQFPFIYDGGDFQSGIFTNLSSVNQNIQYNCVLSSIPATNYAASSFTQFSVPPAFGLPDNPAF